jgi:2-polyprenyl-6-methoxyphenol hydroxylase-like FAD-dependent oxidoreductase
MPSGVDALHQMGLGEIFRSVPGRVVLSWNIWIDGEEVFVIPEPVEELGERAMRVVSQPALLRRIVEEAGRYPAFAFERGARFHDVVRDGSNRVVGAELETEGSPREVRADLIVGCDGRGSPVRTRAGLRLDLLPENYDVLWFRLPAPEALREGCSIAIAVAAGEHPVIYYTSWDGRLQYGLVMPKGSLGEMREKDWVRSAIGPAPLWLAEHVLDRRDEIEGPTRAQRARRPQPAVDSPRGAAPGRRRASHVASTSPGDQPRPPGRHSCRQPPRTGPQRGLG